MRSLLRMVGVLDAALATVAAAIGQWAMAFTAVAILAATVAVWRWAQRQARRNVTFTLLPEDVPPPYRLDRALVYAVVIDGHPLRRPASLCTVTAMAVVLDRRGQDVHQIARQLGCTPQFAQRLLDIEVPDSAWAVTR